MRLFLTDTYGQSQNGFLTLNNIYNLELSSDLIALSACQTALIVGAGLVLGSGILAYNFPVLQEKVKTTTDLVIVSVLVLFVGGLGILMLLSNLMNKKRHFEN